MDIDCFRTTDAGTTQTPFCSKRRGACISSARSAATLLSDVIAADATAFHDGDRWWMFAATAERQSSDWDALSLWSAPNLFGPWTPHPAAAMT